MSTDLYGTAFRTSPMGIGICNAEGRLIDINRACLDIFDVTRDEALGFRPLDDPHLPQDIKRIVLDGETARCELDIDPGGIWRAGPRAATRPGPARLDVTISPLTDSGGEVTGYILHVADITERTRSASIEASDRKRAEHEAGELASFLYSVMEQSPFAMWIADTAGIIIRTNKALRKLLRLSDEQIVGKYNVLQDANLEEKGVMPQVKRVFTEGKTARFSIEWRADHAGNTAFSDASDLWIDAVIFPVIDRHGNIRNVVCQWIDITEQKRAEREREKLQAQLARAQRLEAVGRLAGGVAHDFNNMLSIIFGTVDLAQDGLPASDPLHGDLEEIRKAARRSAKLTSQLLGFARRQTVAPKVMDLNSTVGSMLEMLERLIGEDIDLLWKPAANLEPISIDPTQIDQTLANLVLNARDAIDNVGRVTIETNRAEFDEEYCAVHSGFVPGRFVMLTVSDDGRGMDEKTMAHIFEPFFTDRSDGKGTGLGLATVYGIVKQNRGFINVYSEPDLGTTFRIYLPIAASDRVERAHETAPEPTMTRGHETVLLVEDNTAILDLGRRMLETLGYRVTAAATPGEALRLAMEHTDELHLLVTDVVMPELNGRDLARRVLSLHPEAKCLFTSGYTRNVIAHHSVLEDGVHFLQKPFSINELSAAVRKVLETSE